MCGFQGTRNRKEAQAVRRFSKMEASVTNGRSGSQEERGLHRPLIDIPVTMAKGIHLFPYRTQKLSLSAPMVLGWRRPGRVGRCRIPKRNQPHICGVDFFFQTDSFYSLAIPANVQHCTWLGSARAASCGIEACRAQWAKQAGEASGIARSACATMRVPRVAKKPRENARERGLQSQL